MAWTPVAQAVTAEWFGPLNPYLMERWPDARLIKAEGMKNGEMRRALPCAMSNAASEIVFSPPMPEPIITPEAHFSSSVSGTQPESSTASEPATRARWMKRSIFFWSLMGIHSLMSSLPSALVPTGTWPAILQARSLVSKDWMAARPDSELIRRRQTCSTPSPRGQAIPMPVTTTRRIADDPFAIARISRPCLAFRCIRSRP